MMFQFNFNGTNIYYGLPNVPAGVLKAVGASGVLTGSVLAIGSNGEKPSKNGSMEPTGGGGGGYYGGQAVKDSYKTNDTGSGAGGSNWVNASGSLPQVTAALEAQTEPKTRDNDVTLNHFYGNGRAKIKYISAP